MTSLGELTLPERVEVEVEARSYRRAKAAQSSDLDGEILGQHRHRAVFDRGVLGGAPATRFRELAAELAEEERQERRRDELRYGTIPPSGLIARMREDWPEQAEAVKTLAKRRGIPLGEAWAITIEAGVEALGKRPK